MIVGSFRPDRQFLGGEQVPSRVAVSSRMLVSGNRVYHVGSIWSRWIMSLRPWKLRCSVSLKANPFNKYFPKPKKRTNCYGEIPMENTMLLVTSLMYHEKKPSMRSPCWIRSHPKHLACSYVAARFPPGARRSPPRSPSWNTNGNPRSKCRFAWKNTSKWLMFHCHISLPEGRYPARPIVVTFHVSLLSIKKNFMLQIP